MSERDSSYNSPLQEAFSQRLSRRKFIRQSALALGSLAAGTLLRTHESSAANAFDGGVEDAVPIYNLDRLFNGEIKRPEDLKHFLQTRLIPPDARLAERAHTPINDFTLNPDKELFANLEGYKSPKNRLDKAVLKFFALAEGVRSDTETMAEMEIETVEDRLATPVGEREPYAGLPEAVPEERILELLADPDYRIPLFAYKEGEIDPKKYEKFDIDPHVGIEIELLDDRPERKPMIGLYANYGFTPTVIEHQVIQDGEQDTRYGLRIGLFSNDYKFPGSPAQSPQEEADGLYSILLYQYMESSIYVTPPLMQFYNSTNGENTYWAKRQESQGYVFYPDIIEQIGGPLNENGSFNSAPVLHIDSPNL